MTLPAAIARLQTIALALPGLKAAPTYPPENISVFPFSIAYPERGNLMSEAYNQARGLHTIVVEIHAAPRTMLANAIQTAIPLLEEFHRRLVLDPTLGGACSNILHGDTNNVVYEFGVLEWAGTQTIGTRFHVTVKIREEATT